MQRVQQEMVVILEDLTQRGLDPRARVLLERLVRQCGPGPWHDVARLTVPGTRLPLDAVWRTIAPTSRRMPRGHELARLASRGRPFGMIEEVAEYPATATDALRLLRRIQSLCPPRKAPPQDPAAPTRPAGSVEDHAPGQDGLPRGTADDPTASH